MNAGACCRRARLLIVSPDSRDNLARRQAETPLTALSRFPEPALEHDGRKSFSVELVERSFKDIRALNDDYRDEFPFGAVDRASELQAQIYHTIARPFVRAAVTTFTAQASRSVHPERLSRALMSSRNLMLAGFKSISEQVRQSRAKARVDNPFLLAEALYVQHIAHAMICWRDLRDMMYELMFHSMWNTPLQHYFSDRYEVQARQMTREELRSRPDVQFALKMIATGGFIEAVIRIMALLVSDRGGIRRDRLDRWSRVLTENEPFRSVPSDRLTTITRQQTIIATLEREQAIETLPLCWMTLRSAAAPTWSHAMYPVPSRKCRRSRSTS
ncbi:DUF3141 domain-containing protein [Bradyrhizobium yuanmingense]|uniref:DUF3141 domain-containing protein n=1 Tax=Bradyrhizobium yuanmingense TaxID=108015 RepID=UPI003518CF64